MKNFYMRNFKIINIICVFFLILLTSFYLTYLVIQNKELGTIKQIFIFLYFVLCCYGFKFLQNIILNHKKMKYKHSLFIVMFVLLLLLFYRNSLIPDSFDKSNFTIFSNGEKNQLSNASETWITNIYVNNSPIALKDLPLNEDWHYDPASNRIFLNSSEKESILSVKLKESGDTKIEFLKHAWSGIVEVEDTKIDLYSPDEDIYVYDLKGQINHIPFILYLIYFLGCGILIYYILNFFYLLYIFKEADYNKKRFIYSITAAFYILLIYKLKYVNEINLLLYMLCIVLSYYIFFRINKLEYMYKYNGSKQKLLLYILNLYVTFSFFGEQIFLPLNKFYITFTDVILFILLSFILLPIEYTLLYIFEKIKTSNILFNKPLVQNTSKRFIVFSIVISLLYTFMMSLVIYPILKVYIKRYILIYLLLIILSGLVFYIIYKLMNQIKVFVNTENVSEWKLFCITFCSVFLIELLVLLIYNPGLLTADSFDQYSQAHGSIYSLSDHHPFFHTLCEKMLYSIWDSPYCLIIVQIIFFAIIISIGAKCLYRLGYNKKVILIFVFVTSLLPNNSINVVTLWKDIPFSIAMLWLTILCFKLAVEGKKFFSISSNYIQTIMAMCLCALFRHNGIIVFVGIICVVLFSIFKYKTVKPIIICITSILIIVGIKGPLNQILDVRPNGSIEVIVPIHGLAYIETSNKELDLKTQEFLERYLPLDKWKELYYPYSANTVMYGNIPQEYDVMNKLRESEVKEAIDLYLKELIKEPYLLIKDRLYGTDLLWNVKQGYGGNYRYATLIDVQNNNVGIKHVNNFLTGVYDKILQYLSNIKYFDIFMWRIGIYIDMILLLAYFCIINKRGSLLLCILPIFLNSLSLLLSMAWPDYRYVYFIFLSFGFIFLALFYKKNQLDDSEKECP